MSLAYTNTTLYFNRSDNQDLNISFGDLIKVYIHIKNIVGVITYRNLEN